MSDATAAAAASAEPAAPPARRRRRVRAAAASDAPASEAPARPARTRRPKKPAPPPEPDYRQQPLMRFDPDAPEPEMRRRGAVGPPPRSFDDLTEATFGAQDREGWSNAPIPPPTRDAYAQQQPLLEHHAPGTADEPEPLDMAAQFELPGPEAPSPSALDDVSTAPALEGDGKPRGIEDLLASFPVGDGQHVLRVERLKPSMFHGVQTAGFQGFVRDALGSRTGDPTEEFLDRFGGGEYVLRVYGPPGRGQRSAVDPSTGRPRPRQLSQDVRFVVPWVPPSGRAPIAQQLASDDDEDWIDPVLGHEEEEVDMNTAPGAPPSRLRIPPHATPAAAQIVQHHLEHEDRRQARRDQQEARAEASVAAALPVFAQQAERTVQAVQVSNEQTLSLVRDQLQAERSARESLELRLDEERKARQDEREARVQAERAALQQPRREDPMATVTQLIAAMNNPAQVTLQAQVSSLQAQVGALQAEAARQREAWDAERTRMLDAHRAELTAERAAHDRERVHIEQRADERVRQLDEACARRVREAEETAQRRVRDAEDRAARLTTDTEREVTRRVEEAARYHADASASAEKQHEREVRTLKAMYEGQLKVAEALVQADVKLLTTQNAELKARVASLEQQLANQPDPFDALEKIKAQAAVLGLEEKTVGEPQPTTAQVAMQVGGQVLQQVLAQGPELLEKLVAMRRPAMPVQPAAPPQPQQQPAPSRYPQPPYALPPGAPAPLALPPGARRQPLPPPVIFAVDGARQNFDLPSVPMQPVIAMPPLASVYQEPTPAAPATPPGFAPAAAPPPPAAPPPLPPPPVAPAAMTPLPSFPLEETGAPSASAGDEIPDAALLSVRGQFEFACNQGVEPAAFVAELASMIGPDQLRALGRAVTVDRVTRVILQQPNGAESPFATTRGQNWLSAVLQEAQR